MAITFETAESVAVPFLDLKQQYRNLSPGLDEAIQEVLDSAQYIQGPKVAEFERAFADYCGVQEAIAVDSGTAALHLTLLALDIGPGDEVIIPTNTFIATGAAVQVAGARPVFVDADPDNWQMDLNKVSAAITARTRAAILVHLYGQPVPLTRLGEICSAKGIALIEDAAQAHGARVGGRRAGSLGRAACFSFYPGKNLGAFGDGGAITTNDTGLAERTRRLRDHGRVSKYEHCEVGFNYRMDAVQGVVLNYKLRFLEDWNQRRRYWASRYREQLAGLPLRLPKPIAETEPVHHLFPVCCDSRDALGHFLARRTIETGVHYPIPLHLQPAFRYLGYQSGHFPVAEKVAQEVLSLPVFPELTEQQFEHVCHSISDFFDQRNV
jgi:dTDP-4-amino-4,6-dideoxygalactose transaminase